MIAFILDFEDGSNGIGDQVACIGFTGFSLTKYEQDSIRISNTKAVATSYKLLWIMNMLLILTYPGRSPSLPGNVQYGNQKRHPSDVRLMLERI